MTSYTKVFFTDCQLLLWNKFANFQLWFSKVWSSRQRKNASGVVAVENRNVPRFKEAIFNINNFMFKHLKQVLESFFAKTLWRTNNSNLHNELFVWSKNNAFLGLLLHVQNYFFGIVSLLFLLEKTRIISGYICVSA